MNSVPSYRAHKAVSAILLAVGLFSLTSPAAFAAGTDVTVLIDNFTFSPDNITVTPGTRVTWINHDDIPHALLETNKLFHSKALDTDDSYSFTFTTAGDFSYFCSLHPHMTGKVTVKP